MPIPIKDLARMPPGTTEYYNPEDEQQAYQYIMRNAKSYAYRANGSVETEKLRCISANHNNVITIVRVTVVRQGCPKQK